MRTADFERLYNEHASALLGLLVYRTGDPALAEDLLADTFERVLKARHPFDRRRASEKTWLYTIALNLLRDHARRAAAGSRAVERVAVERVTVGGPPSAPGERELESIEQRDSLQRALATLSPEEREAVSLRYGADLTVPEIAKLKREKLTTVEGRVYRGLRKLKDELE
jgi:RNA polymerase sigma-70 factor (ECF subfamily)